MPDVTIGVGEEVKDEVATVEAGIDFAIGHKSIEKCGISVISVSISEMSVKWGRELFDWISRSIITWLTESATRIPEVQLRNRELQVRGRDRRR